MLINKNVNKSKNIIFAECTYMHTSAEPTFISYFNNHFYNERRQRWWWSWWYQANRKIKAMFGMSNHFMVLSRRIFLERNQIQLLFLFVFFESIYVMLCWFRCLRLFFHHNINTYIHTVVWYPLHTTGILYGRKQT